MQQRALNPPETASTTFFALCQNDLFQKKLLYSEVPTNYTWNTNKKSFERQSWGDTVDGQPKIFKETTIGIIYPIHPHQDECFFLRLYLVNVPDVL